MKRSKNTDQSCRRQEFACKLYGVIKDLEKSLKSDCDQGNNRFKRDAGSPFKPQPPTVPFKKNPNECACPPGCCEDSLQFKLHRIPNYPGLEDNKTPNPFAKEESHGHGSSPPAEDSEYKWHKPHHSNGCWAHGGHGASGGGQSQNQSMGTTHGQSYQPPMQGNQHHQPQMHGSQHHPQLHGGHHQPQMHGGQQSYHQNHHNFQPPSSPEQAMAMGCFVGKAA